jgi:hypothetical protein
MGLFSVVPKRLGRNVLDLLSIIPSLENQKVKHTLQLRARFQKIVHTILKKEAHFFENKSTVKERGYMPKMMLHILSF